MFASPEAATVERPWLRRLYACTLRLIFIVGPADAQELPRVPATAVGHVADVVTPAQHDVDARNPFAGVFDATPEDLLPWRYERLFLPRSDWLKLAADEGTFVVAPGRVRALSILQQPAQAPPQPAHTGFSCRDRASCGR